LQHPKSITAVRVTFFKFPPLVIGPSDCLQAAVINDDRPYESIGRFRAPKGEKHETDTPTYFGTVNRRACRDWVIAVESCAWDEWKLKYRGRRQAKYGDARPFCPYKKESFRGLSD
jgi:hypothetical protein